MTHSDGATSLTIAQVLNQNVVVVSLTEGRKNIILKTKLLYTTQKQMFEKNNKTILTFRIILELHYSQSQINRIYAIT